MSRNYYVVKKDGQWKVKLESGPYLSTHRSQKAAKREALRLARNNNRGGCIPHERYRLGGQRAGRHDR